MASHPIYQLSAKLSDYTPTIWRCFQVPNHITVARLGYIIMTLFEMQASHLFCLTVDTAENFNNYLKATGTEEWLRKEMCASLNGKHIRYEVPSELFDSFDDEVAEDATQTKLAQMMTRAGDRCQMEYDYGDGWTVDIQLEQIIEDKSLPGKDLPRVLDGEGYGIIEDCGGTGGLSELATAFRKKRGSQYKEYCQWLGVDSLDLITFDIEDMNFRVKKVPRIYTELYEYGYAPTKRSMDILTRKYKK